MPFLLILGIPAGLAALGYAVDKTGEGIESTSNAAIKIAGAFALVWFVKSKLK